MANDRRRRDPTGHADARRNPRAKPAPRKNAKVKDRSERRAVDAIDIRLLDALQKWGRSSLLSLSGKSGLTSPTVLRRIRGLEQMGIIRGYRATLDRSKLGFEELCFFTVQLSSQSDRAIAAFESLVKNWPNVRECSALSGYNDFLLKCVFRDARERDAFAAEILAKAATVERISTLTCTAIFKDERGAPLSENPEA
jgi:DNA-binding Lrp family transcriptional regulator